jgi:hypothetical protein
MDPKRRIPGPRWCWPAFSLCSASPPLWLRVVRPPGRGRTAHIPRPGAHADHPVESPLRTLPESVDAPSFITNRTWAVSRCRRGFPAAIIGALALGGEPVSASMPPCRRVDGGGADRLHRSHPHSIVREIRQFSPGEHADVGAVSHRHSPFTTLAKRSLESPHPAPYPRWMSTSRFPALEKIQHVEGGTQ